MSPTVILMRKLEHRLVLYVTLGLLLFSLISGGLTYRYAYEQQLDASQLQEKQLIRTVQAQADVAAFAENQKIAVDVIEGLLANPLIQAVRLETGPTFRVERGSREEVDFTAGHRFHLYSPVDHLETIGLLIVVRNEALIRQAATQQALEQTALLLMQICLATALIIAVSRRVICKPITELAQTVAAITPGSSDRLLIPPLHENDEIGFVSRSINTLLQAAEGSMAELQNVAITDYLTGVASRRYFMARMEVALAEIKENLNRQTMVVMLDLDNFKSINDTYGHAAGDALLQHFANLLRTHCRPQDTAGRLGGEEFGVLLPDTTPETAQTFAETLRTAVAKSTVPIASGELHMTISAGITVMQPSDPRPETALARADHALYFAKEHGRNRVQVEI